MRHSNSLLPEDPAAVAMCSAGWGLECPSEQLVSVGPAPGPPRRPIHWRERPGPVAFETLATPLTPIARQRPPPRGSAEGKNANLDPQGQRGAVCKRHVRERSGGAENSSQEEKAGGRRRGSS